MALDHSENSLAYDVDQIRASIDRINNAYEAYITAMGDNMQTNFVNEMGMIWACNYAQRFFEAFRVDIDSRNAGAWEIFNEVVQKMNEGSIEWANTTESTPATFPFQGRTKNIDTSVILENIGGVRGIDKASTPTVVGQLRVIANKADAALSAAVNAVHQCGFIGGGQEGELVAKLESIKNNINNIITEYNATVNGKVDETVTAFGDTAGRIRSNFEQARSTMGRI